MRQLIDTEFIDNTSYPQQVSGDVGCIVIDHFTGPVNKLNKLSFDNFIALYPPTRGVALTPSYVNAYRAYQAGLQQVEVVCLQGQKKYFMVVVSPEGEATEKRQASFKIGDAETEAMIIGLKYPGNMPELYDTTNKYYAKVEVKDTATEIEGVPDVKVSLIRKYTDSMGEPAEEVVESVTGGFQEGVQLDGTNYDIAQLLNASKYFIAECNFDAALVAVEAQEFEITKEEVTAIESTEIASQYLKWFKNIESSVATIAIDPGTTSAGEAQNIIQLAEYRQNLTTMVGYPLKSTFSKDEIKSYFQPMKLSMFAAPYAIRELVTISGKKYLSNGMGALAGTYASVAEASSVNQVPSAKTWGSFPGVLEQALEFDDILELQEAGINSIYNSVDGPRLWGLRSLFKRETSYFSKFNVARTIARILQYAFNVAIDAIHTGHTSQRESLTQNLLQADLNRLIAQDAIKINSQVICDASNNSDLDTNGGEYLIIDMNIWFVKLIERVKIRITATDSTVSAQISQG